MRKFSTSTVLENGQIVPWLAARGDLSYSPENPPNRNYYFQYSWVFPEVLNPEENKRRHFWFGYPDKDAPDVRFLFDFWDNARGGNLNKIYQENGSISDGYVTAPIGIYRHKSIYSFKEDNFIFIQHGSYLIGEVASQSELEKGHLILYRGVQNAPEYRLYRLGRSGVRRKLMNIHAETLTDSAVSFNAVHSNVCRSETGFLRDRHRVWEDVAAKYDLTVGENPAGSLLYSGYALENWCGINKFGPNYVKFRTPVTNIRITTFIANETEVKVIDPNKLEIIEAVGCKVKEVDV